MVGEADHRDPKVGRVKGDEVLGIGGLKDSAILVPI